MEKRNKVFQENMKIGTCSEECFAGLYPSFKEGVDKAKAVYKVIGGIVKNRRQKSCFPFTLIANYLSKIRAPIFSLWTGSQLMAWVTCIHQILHLLDSFADASINRYPTRKELV